MRLPYLWPYGLTNLGGGTLVRVAVAFDDLRAETLSTWECERRALGLVPILDRRGAWVNVPEGEEAAWAERLAAQLWVRSAESCMREDELFH